MSESTKTQDPELTKALQEAQTRLQAATIRNTKKTQQSNWKTATAEVRPKFRQL